VRVRLVVDGFGKFLGVQGETLVVREGGKTVAHVHPRELEQVIISGKGSVSTDALKLLAEHGVEVLVVDFRGEVMAFLMPPMMRTVSTRREQYFASRDFRGAEIAKAVVYAKMRNQRAILGTLAKVRKDTDPELAKRMYTSAGEMEKLCEEVRLIKGNTVEEVREALMNLEGRAAGFYWGALRGILGKLGFEERSGRYARDPANALLNYGYGILLGDVWRAVHYAGLDPYGGFLHADRPGKPSMVLDLMEEFRPHVVDRLVAKLVSKRMISLEGFELVNGVCQMKDEVRRFYLGQILGELASEVRYRDQKFTWSELILHQARQLAKFLRGEVASYEGFWQRW
jgi:CRISPR-associated protein Cas1